MAASSSAGPGRAPVGLRSDRRRARPGHVPGRRDGPHRGGCGTRHGQRAAQRPAGLAEPAAQEPVPGQRVDQAQRALGVAVGCCARVLERGRAGWRSRRRGARATAAGRGRAGAARRARRGRCSGAACRAARARRPRPHRAAARGSRRRPTPAAGTAARRGAGVGDDQRTVDQAGRAGRARRPARPRCPRTLPRRRASVQPSACTARRRSTICSGAVSSSQLQSIIARRVCCRGGAPRCPVASSRNRSSRRATSSCTPERPHPGGRQLQRQRDAVEAPADRGDGGRGGRVEGEPRRRGGGAGDEQLHGAAPPSTAWRPGSASRSGSASGGTGQSTSPARPSGSWLVARIRRPGAARSSRSASSATGSTTCSQLSSTSRTFRWRAAPRRAASTRRWRTGRSRARSSRTSSTVATTSTSRPGRHRSLGCTAGRAGELDQPGAVG